MPDTQLPIVDLSIDFDFFCREEPDWDFAHNDDASDPTLYKQKLWLVRYAMRRLYAETDMREFADFAPGALRAQLERKGLDFSTFLRQRRRLAVADNHKHAFRFFRDQARSRPPDFLINVDAHHDCYPIYTKEVIEAQRHAILVAKFSGQEMPDTPFPAFPDAPGLSCDNWLTWLFDQWPRTRFIQLYPRWKPLDRDRAKERLIEMYPFADWPGIPGGAQVRNIFLCRSPEWVPPHHDIHWQPLVASFRARGGRLRQLERMPVRTAPTEEEAEAAYDALHAQISDVWVQQGVTL